MRRNLQLKAWLLLLLFLSELFSPMHLKALGSGPSQPEMAGFTPAGTTEMVDPFTGDFTYNIPLMDVEGYPVNIAYSSGVTMEQEASWVGLGWNLNVGTINRSVRGLPDDFRGDKIKTETSMKPMRIVKVGGSGVAEFLGLGVSTGYSFIHNNYKGFGLALNNSISASVGPISTGVGLDINSLDGTSVNASLGVSLSTKQSKYGSMSFGGSLGTGFNTRTGQSVLTLGTTAGYSSPTKTTNGENTTAMKIGAGASSSTSLLPIGMNTYTPYPSLKLTTNTYDFSGTVGGAVMAVHLAGRINGSITTQEIEEKDVDAPAYGYLYAQDANSTSLKDFNREKQVALNKTTTHLSPVNFTYDVFSASGHGVSGMFRPFRNDVGILSDPAYKITSSDAKSFGGEFGGGLYFHGGLSYNRVEVELDYGPWSTNNYATGFNFEGKGSGNLYENVYFKAAGDKAESDIDYFNNIGGYSALAFNLEGKSLSASLKNRSGQRWGSLASKKNRLKRAARSKVFSYLTASDASKFALDEIRSTSGNFYETVNPEGYGSDDIPRIDALVRKAHHISEITQINESGERFVFGIPAYNISKQEVTYTTAKETADGGRDNLCSLNTTEASTENSAGVDAYYSSKITPPYAHSYLLTSKLSEDYQDVTGNGVTPDDIGNAYKFDYTRTSSKYQWRIPYAKNKVTFMEGFKSNKLDQKASYSYGEKEMWYLHTIQSKNQVAEFHISPRKDALGVADDEGGQPSSSTITANNDNESFQLDSIILFNKLDRLKNKELATPIKKVEFTYDYSLCPKVENNSQLNGGKLTLKKIEVSYGRNGKGKESPYKFTYSSENPDYNPDNIDRWGNYKPKAVNPGGMSNGDFPYVVQESMHVDYKPDEWASAWSLTDIKLPSGGSISVEYESDDYGFVQQKEAMQMFAVVGAGVNSTYSGANSLYGNNHLYIKRPLSVPDNADPEWVKEWFFGKEKYLKNMYFKFLTDIDSGEKEYVPGYVTAENIGICSNTDYMYIQIKEVEPNAISRTAWGYFRHNLFDVLYQQPNVNNSGVESVVRGIRANVADIRQMFVGVYDYLEGREIAKEFVLNKSFIRLKNPNLVKKGGGSRVKKITTNDNWKTISGEGENNVYGQEYSYTTKDKFGRVISSGVASYEPMIGNDENPFRVPEYYTASESAGHIPAIEDFQERPFGETFFPSASVGYSLINVKNIHHKRGKTSKAITEHKFYTAKDFPVILDDVVIQKVDIPASKTKLSFPFVNAESKSYFAASQGYSIVLNDMHGKPLSTKNYMVDEIEYEGEKVSIRKLLGGTTYNYRYKNTTKGKQLDNKVQVLTKNKIIKEKLLGVEFDLAIENRGVNEKNITNSRHMNLDIFPIPFPLAPIPLIVPNVNSNKVTDIKESYHQVFTKVIQQYGLIESVETFTDQYSTIAYNRLYDATTGEVLLTETVDEHKKNEFQFNIPAYAMQGNTRMGPAYERIGRRVLIEPTSCTTNNVNNSAFVVRSGIITHGDEVLVTPFGEDTKRGWVVVDSSRHEIPVFLCDTTSPTTPQPPPTITYPFIPKYKRLLTTFGRQSLSPIDSIPHYQKGSYKKQSGEILTDVSIYHLKESWANKYKDELEDLVELNDCEIASPDFGPFTDINHIYHSNKCTIADTNFYEVFGTDAQSAKTIFHPDINFDLSEEIKGTNTQLSEFFDMNDAMSGEIELLETSVKNDSTVRKHKKQTNGIHYRITFNETYTSEDDYRVNNDPCLELEDFYFNLKDPGSVTNRRNIIYNGAFGGVPGTGSHIDTIIVGNSYEITTNSAFSRKLSYASIRIEDKQSFRPYLSQKEQLYLIEYTIKNKRNGTSKQAFYLENGRGFEDIPNQTVFTGICANEQPEEPDWPTQVDSIKIEVTQKPCKNNFRLIDRVGNPINLQNTYSFTILRPAERNQLTTMTGNIVSKDKSPLKIDNQGKFIGFLDESNVDILQANNLIYDEGQRIHYTYPINDNPFVSGKLGSFREDSLLRYVSSRYQASQIETSQDGYMETLPDLWAPIPCYQNIFPPDYKAGGSSSGWKLKEKITKYNSSGQAIESENALGIRSSQLTNHRGLVELVASNSKQKNLAYDNFEEYFSFGVGVQHNKPNFRLIPANKIDSFIPEPLLTEGSQNYQMAALTSKHLIEGVAHTGNYSMFVNRSAASGTVNISYPEKSLNTLEQLELADAFYPINEDVTLDVSTSRNDHLAAFKEGLATETKLAIDNILGKTANSSLDFQLIAGDSNGVFKPENGAYVLSIWVKEILEEGTPYAGVSPEVIIVNNGVTSIIEPSGPFINGWQKLEGTFDYNSSSNLNIEFSGGIWGAFFDDLRIHPSVANVNSYVFDRYQNFLKAKLDENNYATFYDYDDANIPSQVKRETEEGILTIRESRQSTNKH